jgi:peptide/nickel transport system substrate-binding protein
MRHLTKLMLVSAMVALMGALIVPAAAQEDMPGPGEGGPVVWGNQRGSGNIDPLIPLRCSGVDCADLNNLMYPTFLGIDVTTSALAAVGEGEQVINSLVTGWEVSEDNLTYTFTMRDDLTWNDGTPVTAVDVYFFWAALQNVDPAETSSSFAQVKQEVVAIDVIDDYTVALTFETASCLALNRAGEMNAIPAHAFGFTMEGEADFDWTTLVGSDFDSAPPVTSGPFEFVRTEPGTAIYLAANQSYADPVNGEYVLPQGLVYLDVPDYNVMAERLIANQPGDVNYMNEPDTAVLPTLLEAQEAGNAQVITAPGRLWHYVSLNLADPSNPQPGLDEDGNPIDQGHHPILGDKRVRQALQYAIDIDAIINGPVNGNGTAMVAGTIPTAFSIHPTLERRPYDLETARAMLDEAGWVATGDPLVEGGDGLRTCQGCEYAEEGTEMLLDLVNPGDVRNDVSVLLQAQFAEIGVQVDVRPLDFNAMYDDNLGAQVYDMAVAGWRGNLPFNADQRDFFGAENDIPSTESAGFNFGSWYNAEFEELSEFISTAPGCPQDEIIAAAHRVQEIMWDEQPYLWLYAFNSIYAAGAEVEGFQPYPNYGWWNMDAWNISVAQ